MTDKSATIQQSNELNQLRQRVLELEQTLSDRQQENLDLRREMNRQVDVLRVLQEKLIAETGNRQHLDKALRAANDQLQAVLEAVPGIVSWISADLRYLGVNRHLARSFNLPPEAFVGQDIGFLHSSSEFREFMQEFFASPVQEDIRQITALVRGSTRCFMIAVQKYDKDRAAFAVGIDITARHEAEEGLRQAEANYRSIFENAIEGIFQTSPDGHYLSANPALARIYGYDSPAELIANLTSIQQQLYVDPARRSEFIRLLQKNDAVLGFESQIYRKDGSLIWISENARVVRDAQGAFLYYEGTVEDITERKQAQAALQQANEQLEQRVEERTHALRELNRRLMIEITERQRVEAVLRTSEAELKALFAAMDDIIVVFNNQGHYVRVLNTNHTLLYKPDVERVGKTIYDVLPLKLANLVFQTIQQALQTQKTVTLEYSLPISRGEDTAEMGDRDALAARWFIANVSPLPDGSVIWVARDITYRKHAEEALRKAEANYRSIFENTIEGIFQTTPDGQHISANPALVKMYGYESEDDLKTHLVDIRRQLYVDPNRRDEFVAALKQHNVISRFESQIYRKDGSIIWTSENARAVYSAAGELLYYEGTVEDITQRKLAEEALRQSEAKERERSQQLTQALTELKQAQTQLVQSEKMSSLGQLVAGVAHEINNPVSFISGNLAYATKYTHSLLEVVTAYQKELSNPSLDFIEYLEAVDLEFILDDLPKLLASMRVGADRIRGIVRSLQSFSRHDEADLKTVNIHEGIDSTLMILQHRLQSPKRSKITVVKDYGTLPDVKCYAGQLNQVFMNIVSNAIDALEHGTGSDVQPNGDAQPGPQITIKTQAIAEDRVHISIKDNGIGMDEPTQKRVFDPFFTTKEVGKGTGLGMSISHQIIVERHKGQIHCSSTLNQGTEFVIELPVE